MTQIKKIPSGKSKRLSELLGVDDYEMRFEAGLLKQEDFKLTGFNKGIRFGAEWRANLSKAHKGPRPWRKGVAMSEEARKAMSHAGKNRRNRDELGKAQAARQSIRKCYFNPDTQHKIVIYDGSPPPDGYILGYLKNYFRNLA